MKWCDLRSALLPHEFHKHKSRGIKAIALLLLCAYLALFLSGALAVNRFVTGIYSDIAEFVLSADSFSLSDGVFEFNSNTKQCYIKAVDTYLHIDTSLSYTSASKPEEDHLAYLFLGNDGAYIYFDGLEFRISIAELYSQMGVFSFDDTLAKQYVPQGYGIVNNLVASISVFLCAVMLVVLVLAVLLLSIIVKHVARFAKFGLDYSQVLYISAGSFIYPFIALAILFIFPNSVLFTAVYFSDLIRIFVAAILLYVIAAFYPMLQQKEKSKQSGK